MEVMVMNNTKVFTLVFLLLFRNVELSPGAGTEVTQGPDSTNINEGFRDIPIEDEGTTEQCLEQDNIWVLNLHLKHPSLSNIAVTGTLTFGYFPKTSSISGEAKLTYKSSCGKETSFGFQTTMKYEDGKNVVLRLKLLYSSNGENHSREANVLPYLPGLCIMNVGVLKLCIKLKEVKIDHGDKVKICVTLRFQKFVIPVPKLQYTKCMEFSIKKSTQQDAIKTDKNVKERSSTSAIHVDKTALEALSSLLKDPLKNELPKEEEVTLITVD